MGEERKPVDYSAPEDVVRGLVRDTELKSHDTRIKKSELLQAGVNRGVRSCVADLLHEGRHPVCEKSLNGASGFSRVDN